MEKITIQDIIPLIAGRTRLSEEDAARLVKAMFNLIGDELKRGNPVKVRGLGTFKIVGVEQRESVNVNTGERIVIDGHEKISFVPDATLRDIVNRPFSQFQTVALNEGVDFSELQTPGSADAETDQSDAEAGPDTAGADADSVEDDAEAEGGTETVETEAAEPETASATDTAARVNVEPSVEESKIDNPEAPEPPVPQKRKSPAEIFLWVLLWVAVVGVSFFLGFLYGSNYDSINRSLGITAGSERPAASSPATSAPDNGSAAPGPAATQQPADTAEAQTESKESKAETASTDYSAKDVRVRTGAYRITGLDRTYTARGGETVKSVSRSLLGEDMECYVEVFNNMDGSTRLQAGQKLKIPRLELKRKNR